MKQENKKTRKQEKEIRGKTEEIEGLKSTVLVK